MEENKTNKQSIILVTFLCACLFGLAVAYSALSTTLNITYGTVTQNNLTWDVGFVEGSITGTKTGTNTVCGETTATKNTVSIANTTLTTLHDKCVYKLTIKNLGDIDATLSSIAAKTPTSFSCNTATTSKMICGNITYSLATTSAGTTLLPSGTTLAKQTGSLDAYLIAEFTGTDTGSSVQNSGGFTLNYAQK